MVTQLPKGTVVRNKGNDQLAKVNWQQNRIIGISYLKEPYAPGGNVVFIEELELLEPEEQGKEKIVASEIKEVESETVQTLELIL